MYRIRNRVAGASLQLDVVYSNQVPMPSLQREDVSAKGQQWSIEISIRFYLISSAGPRPNLHLDT
jgi:hypothetical protein